jgi:hypothetical protein
VNATGPSGSPGTSEAAAAQLTSAPPNQASTVVPAEYDLAGGSVDPNRTKLTDDELAENVERRALRRLAFFVGGGACLVSMTIAVAAMVGVLVTMCSNTETMAVIAHSHDWHYLVLMGVVIIGLTTIPLSLGVAILRLVSPSHKHEEPALSFTTPQLEAVKAVYGMVRGKF